MGNSIIRVAASWPSDTHAEVYTLLCRPCPGTGWVTIIRVAVVRLIVMLSSSSVVHVQEQGGYRLYG